MVHYVSPNLSFDKAIIRYVTLEKYMVNRKRIISKIGKYFNMQLGIQSLKISRR